LRLAFRRSDDAYCILYSASDTGSREKSREAGVRIWLLTVGEPLPTDPGPPRLLRCGIIANLLAARGFEVVWWTTNFRHTEKEKRFTGTTAIEVSPRFKIWCLDSRPYSHNVSIARILSNWDVAAEFRKLAGQEQPPDVLLASYPIPELAQAGAQYAREIGVPSVVDVRDLWPDIWSGVLPRQLRMFASVALLPFQLQSRRTLELFDGISGITEEMVQWGLAKARRSRRQWDRPFPLAYSKESYSESELASGRSWLTRLLGSDAPGKLTLCFFGTLTARTRIDVVIDAIRLLPLERRRQTRLIICGTGEHLDALRAQAAGLPEVLFTGWITGPEISALASYADAGVLPYPSSLDFQMSIPNKTIEYLAHGLPVLTSLRGPVSELIARERCGRLYRETDPADLATTLIDLLDRPAELAEMSLNSRRVFHDRFLAEHVYGQAVDMLMQLAATRRSGLRSQ
jgi:glycosyltransferase involved in cell wall biosynthesis